MSNEQYSVYFYREQVYLEWINNKSCKYSGDTGKWACSGWDRTI